MADYTDPQAQFTALQQVNKLTNTNTPAFNLTGVSQTATQSSNATLNPMGDVGGSTGIFGVAAIPTSTVTSQLAYANTLANTLTPGNPLSKSGAASPVWVPNILSTVEQPAYHIRFYITEDKSWDYASYTSYQDFYQKVIKNSATTVIAETGVTGLNIQSLEIKSIGAPNGLTRSYSANAFTMVITEPLGVNFFDMIVNAAQELKIRNFSKFYYYLEVSFKGYENGTIKQNVCADYSNGGVWLYQVAVTDVDVDANATGSTYTLNMQPYEEAAAFDENNMYLKEEFVPTGKTIGEVLTQLAQALNDAEKQAYGYQLVTYAFTTTPVIINGKKYDPSTWSITPSNVDFNSQRTMELSAAAGSSSDTADPSTVQKGHFVKGFQINDVIELLFMNSEQGQSLAKDIVQPDVIDKPDGQGRNSVFFRFEPRVVNTDYDYYSNNYFQNITIDIKSYYTTKAILTKGDMDLATDTTFQQTNVQNLTEIGYMCKRYDYLFSGLNTEVLTFDFKFNMKWAAVMPQVAGYQNSYTSETMQAKANPNKLSDLQAVEADYQKYQKVVADDKAKVADLQSQQNQLLNGQTADKLSSEDQAKNTSFTNQINAAQTEINAVSNNLKIIGSSAAKIDSQYNQQQAAKLGNLPAGRTKTVRYAEDAVQNDNSTRYPLSTVQGAIDPSTDAGGPYNQPNTRDRSIYAAIMDQMYGPINQSLVTINLEIRGDPYWLGDGNLERTIKNYLITKAQTARNHQSAGQVSTQSVDTSYGDIMLLLTFQYPMGINNSTGNPTLKTNESFTGVYAVRSVTHTFSGGLFKQQLVAQKMERIDAFKAFNASQLSPQYAMIAGNSTVSAQAQQSTGASSVANAVASAQQAASNVSAFTNKSSPTST
jgi:hypothetical protein